LLDPPIVKLEWYNEFDCEVAGVGYYDGPGCIDYFALFMDQYYQTSDHDLLDANKIDRAYMCLNRKPHWHRLRLYQAIDQAGILDQGIVSMGGNPPLRLLDNDVDGQNIAPNGGKEDYSIGNDITTLGNINYWQRHFVNIVTETAWDVDSCNFLSEKTFKPILGLRPFLIYAPNGGIECLQRRGFENYINDFTDMCDIDLKQPYNIPVFLQELCKQPSNYWKMKLVDLREKLLYNQQRFKNYVSEQKNIL